MMPKAAFLVCLYPMQTVFEDLNFQRHHLIFNVITSHHRKHFCDLGSQHRNLFCLQSTTKSSLHHLQISDAIFARTFSFNAISC